MKTDKYKLIVDKIKKIEKLTLRAFDMKQSDYLENLNRNFPQYAEVRYCVASLSKKYIKGCTLYSIGDVLDKDHSQVLFMLKRCAILCEVDPIYSEKVNDAEKLVLSSDIFDELKPCYFFGFVAPKEYNVENVNKAIEALLLKGYYVVDIHQIVTKNAVEEFIDGIVILRN